MKLVQLYRILLPIEVGKKKLDDIYGTVMEQRVFSEDLK